jgi:hypothetical protein
MCVTVQAIHELNTISIKEKTADPPGTFRDAYQYLLEIASRMLLQEERRRRLLREFRIQ